MTVRPAAGVGFDLHVPTLIVGGGAAGLTAALAALEAGDTPLVLERDRVPSGNTALSAGLIPAAGTRFQRDAGIADTPDRFAADIQRKAHDQADSAVVDRLVREAAPTVEWLADRHGVPLDLVRDFDYPGHCARRMHGTPRRSGAELLDHLRAAVERNGGDLIGDRVVTTLFADDAGLVAGVEAHSPDGGRDRVGCDRLILACNGYGANRDLVTRHIPEMADALYFGHEGNRGDALLWGEALGAAQRQLGAYQGHGSVAHPHGILISWAAVMEGGFLVNARAERFSDESAGYSEHARRVLAQPGGIAWVVFDARIAGVVRQFEDFRLAEAQGAVLAADDPAALAVATGLPADALAGTLEAVDRLKVEGGQDGFGRVFADVPRLAPPYRAVRVTGALFHTQGGLRIDAGARVLRSDGTALPNLFAAGGAACGVSGSADDGYLSGNGLLTAVVLGRIAGALPSGDDRPIET